MRALIFAIVLSAPQFVFAHASDVAEEAKKVACLDQLARFDFSGTTVPVAMRNSLKVQDSKGRLFAWDGSKVYSFDPRKNYGDPQTLKEHLVWNRDSSTALRSGKSSPKVTTVEMNQVLDLLIMSSMGKFASDFEKSKYSIGKKGVISRDLNIAHLLNTCAPVKGPLVPIRQPIVKGTEKKLNRMVTLEQYKRFVFALRPALAEAAPGPTSAARTKPAAR